MAGPLRAGLNEGLRYDGEPRSRRNFTDIDRGILMRGWMTGAGLIAMMMTPALAAAPTAGTPLVPTTPHFAFYSDVATNATTP